jgi:hypothetical protein
LGVNDDVRFFGDNSGSWTVEVEITESLPDLQPTAITFDPSTAVVGGTVFFDSGISNTGDIDTGVFNIEWFVDGQDVGAAGSHAGVPANSTVLDGNSQFSWVATAGTHTIEFVVDVDNHVEESNESNNSRSVTVTVSEEQILGSITAHAFQDTNQNGVQDPEEVSLDGWAMTLYEGGGCIGATLDSGVTDANGNFTVDGLLAVTYSVQETLQKNWVNIAPLCQSVMSAGQSQTIFFSNWPKGGKPPTLGGSELGILLPFSIGQEWTICQGYNGEVSHTGTDKYALDLSLDPNSAGPRGCVPGPGASASDNQIVTAPGDGKVVSFLSHDSTNDLVCIDLDAGGSVRIGHIVPQKADGTPLKEKDPVAAGDQIGIVLPLSQSSTSEYAHIHIAAYSKSKCLGSSAVPFIGAFQFQCVPPLPNEGDAPQNQHSGKSYTRCY